MKCGVWPNLCVFELVLWLCWRIILLDWWTFARYVELSHLRLTLFLRRLRTSVNEWPKFKNVIWRKCCWSFQSLHSFPSFWEHVLLCGYFETFEFERWNQHNQNIIILFLITKFGYVLLWFSAADKRIQIFIFPLLHCLYNIQIFWESNWIIFYALYFIVYQLGTWKPGESKSTSGDKEIIKYLRQYEYGWPGYTFIWILRYKTAYKHPK